MWRLRQQQLVCCLFYCLQSFSTGILIMESHIWICFYVNRWLQLKGFMIMCKFIIFCWPAMKLVLMGFKYIIFKKTLVVLVRSVRALLCSGCCRHVKESYLSWWRMNKYNTHNSVQLLFTCKVTQAITACLLWLFKTDCLCPLSWGYYK